MGLNRRCCARAKVNVGHRIKRTGCGKTADRPDKRSRHDSKALAADLSRAESDDRILKEKRIERHDGSGDRQKCRPPFCFSAYFGRGRQSGAAREAAAGSVESWSALGERPSRRWREGDMVPDEGIEPPTFGLQNRCSTAELSRRRLEEAGRGRHAPGCPPGRRNTRLHRKVPEPARFLRA